MEFELTYCTHCDKKVRTAVTRATNHAAHANVPDGGLLVCLDVGEDCEGATCALSGTSTLLMGVRLARSGVIPDEEWPHVDLMCEDCNHEVGMEVIDRTHVFCPVCQTTHAVTLKKGSDGTYEVGTAS